MRRILCRSGPSTLFVNQQSVNFTWTEEYDKAFLALKKRLLEALILAFLNFELPFNIDTDASDTALGSFLSPVIDGLEYPIAFESRVLTKTKVNYATTKREALVANQAVQWFRPFIYNSKCSIPTDHARFQLRLNLQLGIRTDGTLEVYSGPNSNPREVAGALQ